MRYLGLRRQYISSTSSLLSLLFFLMVKSWVVPT